jgi:hypothetical protein
MSTYKRVSGDYNIVSVGPTDNVIINTHTIKVNGNLDVVGNVTYIDVTEVEVRDPFITLNVSNTPSNTSSYFSNSGILTHKTSTTYAGFRYNNNLGAWELSVDTTSDGEGGTWTLVTSGNLEVAGANTQVQFNNNGLFGASANFTFDSAQDQLTVNGAIVLPDQNAVPSAVTAAAVIYGNIPGGGDTGVYFNNTTNNDELVSRSRAIALGLIL